jgi:hypothetical protein
MCHCAHTHLPCAQHACVQPCARNKKHMLRIKNPTSRIKKPCALNQKPMLGALKSPIVC